MKKAVFFDIDGTLWDNRMQIPKSTVTSIKRLKENGHYAFLCSGRSRAAIQAEELLLGIGFDGILAACGTHVEYQGKLIYERNLSEKELDELFSIFQTYRLPVVLEGKHCLYADMEDFEGNVYISNLKKSLGEGFQSLSANAGNYTVNKVTGYFKDGDYEKMKEELSVNYDLIFHSTKVFEIIPKGFSKASGIQKICEYLKIRREDTYAFGDSSNDLEMLQYAGYGISMGNGTIEAKRASDYVTADIWDDGIKKGLQQFSLI